MITIHVINIVHDKYSEEFRRKTRGQTFNQQFKYIKEIDKNDGDIYVLPYPYDDFIIYKYFIKNILDERQYAIDGIYSRSIRSKCFNYKIVNEQYIPK